MPPVVPRPDARFAPRGTSRRRRPAVALLLLVPTMACADLEVAPRPLEELAREGSVLVDPATKAPYTGPVVSTFEDRPQVVAKRLYVRDGALDGPYEAFFANERLSLRETYRGGRRHGPYESYFESGRLFEEGSYRMGRLDGPYRAYWADPELEETGTYRAGALDGPRAWFLHGDLVERVTYQNGEIVGPYERYARDGSLELRGILSGGRPCGVWIQHGSRVDHGPCEASTQ